LPALSYGASEKKALIDSAWEISQRWRGLKPAEHIRLQKNVLRRITVSHDGIRIALSRSALLTELAHDQSRLVPLLIQNIPGNDGMSGDLYEVSIPAQLRRCGIETKLIIAESAPQDVHGRTRHAVQSALAKALEWNQLLISGEASSMAALAKREGVTQRYISHLLKLAYLAPDIMAAILKGLIPYDLTLTRLKKGLPLNWAEQRKTLGFTR